MQDQTASEISPPAGIATVLIVAEPVVIGLSVLAIIKIINQGNSPVSVSSRLNLFEGDVQLLVTDPAGSKQKVMGAGGQPDTALRRTSLAPGQQIAAGINLLYTSCGEIFNMPGTYILEAVYFPTPLMEPVNSNPVSVAARMPQTETERQLASLLKGEELKRAIVIPESDSPVNRLEELAARFPDTQDGKMASLIIAGNRESQKDAAEQSKVFSSSDLITTALWISALSTPFGTLGERLRDSFATFLESQVSGDKSSFVRDSGRAAKALKIAREQPLENGF